MQLSLKYYGNPVLRKKALPVKEVNEEIKELVHAMDKLMITSNGVGLAAPQAGISLRIFIMRLEEEVEPGKYALGDLQVFINPVLSSPSDSLIVFNEGCLSIPKLRADVQRPTSIFVEAEDLEGNRIQKRFDGLAARCIMHENDHLNGVLFIDRLSKKERDLLEPDLRKIKKTH